MQQEIYDAEMQTRHTMHHPFQATIDHQLEQFAVQKQQVQHWTFLPKDAHSNPHQSLSSQGFKPNVVL